MAFRAFRDASKLLSGKLSPNGLKHHEAFKNTQNIWNASWIMVIQIYSVIHGYSWSHFFWIFMLFSFFLFQGTASYDLHLDCHGLIKYPHEKSGKKVEDEEGWWDSALFSIDRWINRTWPLQGSFSHAGHGHFMWPFRMPGMIAGWLRVTWSNCFLRSRDRRCSLATWVLSQSYIDDRW